MPNSSVCVRRHKARRFLFQLVFLYEYAIRVAMRHAFFRCLTVCVPPLHRSSGCGFSGLLGFEKNKRTKQRKTKNIKQTRPKSSNPSVLPSPSSWQRQRKDLLHKTPHMPLFVLFSPLLPHLPAAFLKAKTPPPRVDNKKESTPSLCIHFITLESPSLRCLFSPCGSAGVRLLGWWGSRWTLLGSGVSACTPSGSGDSAAASVRRHVALRWARSSVVRVGKCR